MKQNLLLLCWIWIAMASVSAQDQSCSALLSRTQQEIDSSRIYAAYKLLKGVKNHPSCSAEDLLEYHILRAEVLVYIDSLSAGLTQYQKAIQLAGRAPESKVRALLGASIILHQQQNFQSAQAYRDQAYDILSADSTFSPILWGSLKMVESQFLITREEYDPAIPILQKANEYFSDPNQGDSLKVAQALSTKGYVYNLNFQTDSAEKVLQKSLNWQKRNLPEEHLDLAKTYYYLGQTAFRNKDHGRAEEFHKACLRIRQNILGHHHSILSQDYNMLGLCYWREGKINEAITSLARALELSRASLGETHRMVGSLHLNLGMLRSEAKDMDGAVKDLLAALDILTPILGPNSRQILAIHNNLGLIYFQQKQYKKATQSLQKAYAVFHHGPKVYHPYPARIASNLARAYRELLQFEDAIQWHQLALSHLVPGLDPDPFAALPSSQGPVSGELVEIMRHKGETLLFKNEGPNPNEKEIQAALGIFSHANNLIDSLRLGFRAEESKLHYGTQSRMTYEGGLQAAWMLFQLTKEEKYKEMAFAFCERNKALVLLEAIQLDEAVAFAEVPKSIKKREAQLRQEMAGIQQSLFEIAKKTEGEAAQKETLENELFVAKQSYDSLIQVFERDFPAYFHHKYDLNVATISDTREMLPDSTAWLEYFVGEQAMHLFCLTKDSVIWLQQEIRPDFGSRIQFFRQAIYSPFFEGKLPGPEQQYEEQGLDLYQELLAPLIDRFPVLEKKWILVADGALGHLPFDALLTNRVEQQGKYKTYPYLSNTYQISYAYSATLLRELMERNNMDREANEAIAFAPGFEEQASSEMTVESLRAGLGPLPFSQKEVEEIKNLINCKTLTSSSASKEAFLKLAPQSRLIHLSTHAKSNDEQAELSCVVFAGPDSLTAHEIAVMDLEAELVVLSACETGIGTLYEGEGILSLARGFTYAGSQSLLTTLWSVNDATTSEIMREFYRGLAAGLPKDQALHQAKLTHVAEKDQLLAHPFFWAGYTLMGNPHPVEDLQKSSSFPWYVLVFVLGLLFAYAMYRSQQQLKHEPSM